MGSSNEFQRIMFPEGASFSYTGVGAIKILLPIDWSNTMMKFKVEVFNYRTDKSFSLEIAGYPWSGGGGYWVNTSAAITGGKNHPQIAVRFGHDGNKPCVIIGEINNQWAAMNMTISDLYVRMLANTTLDNWIKGWDIESISILPTNIDTKHFVSSAHHTLSSMTGSGRETSKFYLWLNSHAPNTGLTIGKLHLPGGGTFSFNVTVSGFFGTITYQITGYSGGISKNIVEANPRLPNIVIDELIDVEIQYNTNPNEAVIQIVNNSPTGINHVENVIVESNSNLYAPYFTPLDHSTPISPVNYVVNQNSARGKWGNTSNQSINDLDQTISRNGDVFINNVAKGLIVKDQIDGNCYRLTTSNGVVNAILVTCPQ